MKKERRHHSAEQRSGPSLQLAASPVSPFLRFGSITGPFRRIFTGKRELRQDFCGEGYARRINRPQASTLDSKDTLGGSGSDGSRSRTLSDILRGRSVVLRGTFTVRFLLPGSFANMYMEIQRVNSSSPHLVGLLEDFEKSFDRYARTQDPHDLRICIGSASNYAEGLASATFGTPKTLGFICDQLTDWPHDKVKEALKNLYHFCSDYPGIRHGGNPASAKRALSSRDLTMASLLILSFSGYLSPHFDERTILGL